MSEQHAESEEARFKREFEETVEEYRGIVARYEKSKWALQVQLKRRERLSDLLTRYYRNISQLTEHRHEEYGPVNQKSLHDFLFFVVTFPKFRYADNLSITVEGNVHVIWVDTDVPIIKEAKSCSVEFFGDGLHRHVMSEGLRSQRLLDKCDLEGVVAQFNKANIWPILLEEDEIV